MTTALTLISLLYIIMLAVLLLVLSFSRLPILVKLVLTAMVAGVYVLSWQTWKDTQGWPGKLPLPEKFILHASVIEEPDPEAKTPGRIFIWASDLIGDYPADEPRAYELPYDKDNHSALAEALRQQRDGKVQLGGIKEPEGKLARRKTISFGENRKSVLEFSTLPDPALPEK